MEQTDLCKIHPSNKEIEEEWKNLSQNLIQTLPKMVEWSGRSIHLYEGIWYPEETFPGLLYFQKYFKPHDTDIILASNPKSGTHWLKALSFTIVNRSHYSLENSPLLNCDVDRLVPLFELNMVQDYQFLDLDIVSQPRIFNTHASYGSLPSSIKDSRNKIVYICRNPLDQVISFWIFLNKISKAEEITSTLDEAFEMFFQGNHVSGPFWDHILGYWHASIERPDKVLFLKYEDLKRDNAMCIKTLATFLGFPFSEDEEKKGLIEEISKLCSIERMKNLEVNKTGENLMGIANNVFFRKG